MEQISIDELHNRVASLGQDELILDVRTAEEFASGHIKGARNKAHEEVEEIAEELKTFKTVYVHCKMGGRAQHAANSLETEGLENVICVSDGGMHRWAEMGWEME